MNGITVVEAANVLVELITVYSPYIGFVFAMMVAFQIAYFVKDILK